MKLLNYLQNPQNKQKVSKARIQISILAPVSRGERREAHKIIMTLSMTLSMTIG